MVQVLDVRWLNPVSTWAADASNFICTHNRFITLSEALSRPVNLYATSIEKMIVTLAELNEGQDIYDVRTFALYSESIKHNAKLLYQVPLDVFLQHTESIDVSRRRIVYLHHSYRCGSTLFSQMFQDLPGWKVVSENQYLLAMLTREVGDVASFSQTDLYKKLVVSGIKYHVSQFGDDTSVFIKSTLYDQYAVRVIPDNLPQVEIVYAYREPLTSAKSWYHAFYMAASVLEYYFDRLSRDSFDQNPKSSDFRNIFGLCHPIALEILRKETMDNFLQWYILLWSITTRMLLEDMKSMKKIKCVKYEKFQEEPEATIRKLFDHLDIDSSYVSFALEAAKRDSQAGLFFSHENRRNNRKWQRTEEEVDKCNRILAMFDLPDLDTDFIMPETL